MPKEKTLMLCQILGVSTLHSDTNLLCTTSFGININSYCSNLVRFLSRLVMFIFRFNLVNLVRWFVNHVFDI